jgi:hypothetical protein
MTPLYRDANGNLTLTVPGDLPPEYAKAMQQHGDADPVVATCMALLDAYVSAYDRRGRYRGSSIAEDATVDHAYNGMLRREEERAVAFIARVCNPVDDPRRPGLGGGDKARPLARYWLLLVSEADKSDRAARRRGVHRELRNMASEPS